MFAAPALADRLSVDVQSAQALRAQAANGDPQALRAAARQFEAMMVQMMLKTMRETQFAAPDDPLTGGDTVKLYRELLDQQWAQKVAGTGGLGFADMLVKQLEPSSSPYRPAEAGPTAGSDGTGRAGFSPPPPLPAEAGPTAAAPEADKKARFIAAMLPHAEAAQQATGVPARFILAHAALESGWGERQITTAAGTPSYNLFGIKTGADWTGDAADSVTTEYRHGLAVKTTERFRAYAGYAEAFMDYAKLLVQRYASAAQAGGDANAFANAVSAGGYATDPAYASKLVGVIASVARAGV